MICRRLVHGHGAAGTFNGWFTIVRGDMISRRLAIRVLLLGPVRSKIDVCQTQDREEFPV